jgi:predicted RNA methylase
MFNKDFYPTPKDLADKMVSMIDTKFSKNILEPSAGKGDLVNAMRDKYDYRWSRRTFDVMENDPELIKLLRGTEFVDLVDTDFLAYSGSKQYDTIIMNPPFSNGVRHVLRAWDIMYNGDVIAIINAENIRNPHTADMKMLIEIIEQNGSFEFITGAFQEAERTTNVEVALIKLSKRNDVIHDYFSGMKENVDGLYVPEIGNDLTICDNEIGNAVRFFNMAKEKGIQAILSRKESAYYMRFLFQRDNDVDNKIEIRDDINDLLDDLKDRAWSHVMTLTQFQKIVTEKVEKKIRADFDEIKKMEFTESNVRMFLLNLVNDSGSIQMEAVDDVFDMFTRYHAENRVHVEGWKSNDYFFINKRVVLPYFTELSWTSGVDVKYEARAKLRDIEKVMKIISGKAVSDIPLTDLDRGLEAGRLYETDYFKVRFYKKGTAHFIFKDLKLLERFNVMVGKHRNWLPKQDEKIPEKFWIMNKG